MTARPLALVTGGCRRIGAAIAARLAEAGYDLALHASGDCRLEEGLEARLNGAGAQWQTFAADFGQDGAVEGLVPQVAGRFGRRPDLLVNNASRFEWDGPDSVTAEGLIGHHRVNTAAPALLARAVAEGAWPERQVVIVNILDQRVAQPNADQLSYTLSKLALGELTMILARHWAPHVRVVAIAPGLTLPTESYSAEQMAALAESMPLARLPAPEDICDALIYLLGAGAVTGQTIFVDGGAHLCRYERDFLYLEA